MLKSLNTATELVKGLAADETPRAAHDGNVMQTFHLVLQFHDVIHYATSLGKVPDQVSGN